MKFRNGVEESVWVSFLCSLLDSEFEGVVTVDDCIQEADLLLTEYRARLEDGKPNVK